MSIIEPNPNRLKFFFTINFSLFSALAICQIIMDTIYNPWLFLLCLMGAIINIFVLCFIVYKNLAKKTLEESSVSESEKDKLMNDLEEEAKRRKHHDRIQQN